MIGMRRFHVQWLFAKTYYNYGDVSAFFYSRNIPPFERVKKIPSEGG